MKHLVLLLAFGIAGAAQATCMMTCEDLDAGDDPGHFGAMTLTTSCAAPGGPVSMTRETYFDACGEGQVTEHVCGPTAYTAQKKVYRCTRCDPTRTGVCLRVGSLLSEGPPGVGAQSCTTVTGDGPPDPTPTPEP
jgi:hypothetical protein